MSDDEKSSVASESVSLKTEAPPLKVMESKKRGKSPVPAPSSQKKADDSSSLSSVSSSMECKVLTQYQRVVSLSELRQELEQPSVNQWSLEEIDFRLQFLESLWHKFSSVHDSLEDTCTAAFLTHHYVTSGTYTKAYRPYQEARLVLLKLKEKIKSGIRERTSEHDSSSSVTSRQRLPEISLPQFSGEYSQWVPFRDLFSAMVRDNDSISNVEKMHYLRTSLSGSAAQLVANLPVSGDSFQAAWNQLTSRYDNKRLLITAQLDKLFGDNSSSPRTAAGLNALINSTTEALDALNALGAPVAYWDHVLVHHLTRRLDSSTRESWEVKLGSSTEPPTYEQLKVHITGRARALESIELGKASPSTSRPVTPSTSRSALRTQPARSYAMATAEPGFPCSMCQGSHFIVLCAKFRALSQQARRDCVVQKRLCFNCLGPHSATACHSTKRCKDCGGKHHTMIHVGAPGQSPSSAGISDSATSSSSKQ